MSQNINDKDYVRALRKRCLTSKPYVATQWQLVATYNNTNQDEELAKALQEILKIDEYDAKDFLSGLKYGSVVLFEGLFERAELVWLKFANAHLSNPLKGFESDTNQSNGPLTLSLRAADVK